jgi:hypothetical protein
MLPSSRPFLWMMWYGCVDSSRSKLASGWDKKAKFYFLDDAEVVELIYVMWLDSQEIVIALFQTKEQQEHDAAYTGSYPTNDPISRNLDRDVCGDGHGSEQ